MTRPDLIKAIITLFGASVLSQNIGLQQQKIYLLQTFIRGFKLCDGPRLPASMKEADLLNLIREPHNPPDANYLAVLKDPRYHSLKYGKYQATMKDTSY